ncbi:MAG: VWA domain-containing protein [Deltaproteobacteria bacterium]|nr:VWA domain-containing protein [Deltaproteobacteria bacterium]
MRAIAVGLGLLSLVVCGLACEMSMSRAPMEQALEGEALPPGMNTESYSRIDENPFEDPKLAPLSTFGIDVDTASYSNVRRFLTEGQRPPKDAVRLEELINYFPYHDAPPTDGKPFAVTADVFGCAWAKAHRLVRIGLKGRELPPSQRPPANLVFLIDVSGSMFEPNKLPLAKRALRLLVDQMRSDDHIALVVYAGNAGLVLPPTSGSNKAQIADAIDRLEAGGSTAGAAGIELAYQTAQAAFIPGGVNRVILATDGDWNVGVSDDGSLTRLIEEKAKGGVFLTVLGFGMGNYKDSKMQQLADHGNGNYGYIDNIAEARKLLVEQAAGTLVTIAKDVKVQVEFNPAQVSAYRLIGYEKRALRARDFNDDTKDAGELGAGHTVTALYEVVPTGTSAELPPVDALRYQKSNVVRSDELMTLKLRYKQPEGATSELLAYAVHDDGGDHPSADARFAAAVAEWGLLLRDSPNKGAATMADVIDRASATAGNDTYRQEFVELVKKSAALAK